MSVKKFSKDISFNNIIVVPDKLTLYLEQKIFEVLNIPVYFNITVMGISKLANEIILENNINFAQCTEIEAKLLTLIAIQNSCKNFKCFSKKYTLGFVDEIYAKIEQIKSSNANIEDLIDENADIGTKLKFEDLKLIYKEYEVLRQDKLDSGALLSLYNNLCNKSTNLKKSNVFFMGFESMTKQGIEVLKNTAINCNHTEINITHPHNQNNHKIYDETFFKSVLNLCKENFLESKVNVIKTEFNSNKFEILNNLFSRKQKYNKSNDFFSIYKAPSPSDEITNCIKHINFLLKEKNLNFKDIAICAPQNFHTLLESQLNNLGIDTYRDTNFPLFNCEPITFIFNILKYQYLEKDKIYLVNIIQNSLCELDINNKHTLLTLIEKHTSISSILKYEKDINKDILTYIKELNNLQNEEIGNLQKLVIKINNIIEKYNIFEKTEKLCKTFNLVSEISLEKQYLQIPDKITNLLNTLINIHIPQNTSNEEILKIFEKALKETTILGIPSTVNQLFIGDIKNFYYDKKYVFMLGMNEDITPQILLDTGLITDKEILSDTIKAKLEPTTQIINKRNKFKVFEILLSAKEKTILSYHSQSSDGKQMQPSEFVTELKYLYQNNEIMSEYFLNHTSDQDRNFKLQYILMDPYNANLSLRKIQDHQVNSLIKNALIDINSLYLKPINKNVKINLTELFFKNNKTSISVIEKYNKCPKSAFYSNALKLNKNKQDKIEASIIGNFIHEVGEIFVKKNKNQLGLLPKPTIEEKVNKICLQVLQKEAYFAINLEKNKFILKVLKLECIRFCDFLNYEQSNSHFKATLTEQHFGATSKFKPIEIFVKNKKYTISGIIDRVDEFENNFRIIDYKTGNITNSKGKDLLYYGTKIQLFVYAEAIKNNLGKKLFGAFYLPIRNSFSKNDTLYQLSGFFKNDTTLIKLCDQNLSIDNKSQILNCSLNKNGDTVRKANNILSEEQIDAYIKYAIEIVRKTILNIDQGFIDYSPFEKSCDICEFNNICKMANEETIIRNEKYNIKNETYEELNYDNNWI